MAWPLPCSLAKRRDCTSAGRELPFAGGVLFADAERRSVTRRTIGSARQRLSLVARPQDVPTRDPRRNQPVIAGSIVPAGSELNLDAALQWKPLAAGARLRDRDRAGLVDVALLVPTAQQRAVGEI